MVGDAFKALGDPTRRRILELKAAAKCDARFGLTKRFYCVILYTP